MPGPGRYDNTRTELTVTVERGDAVRVAVIGEIDLSTSDELSAQLTGALAPDGPAEMLVDLSGVRLLDASGVGVLLGVRRRAESYGIAFRATGAVGLPRTVMEITGVLDVLGGKG